MNKNLKKIAHLVMDVESTSLNPNCCMLEIAMVPIPPSPDVNWDMVKSSMSFHNHIDLESCKKAGFEMSAKNFYWWISRNKAARKNLREGLRAKIRTVLNRAIKYLRKFDEPYIWSHKDFDAAALRTAYRKLDIDTPFKKEQLMDLRTSNYQSPPTPDIERKTPKHIALNDAIHEAKIVRKQLKSLNKKLVKE